MKTCSRCKETKPLNWFNENQRYCQNCVSEYNAQYNKKNQEKKQAYMSEYYQDNKEERQGYQAEYSKTEKGIMVKRLAESRRRARIKKTGYERFSYEDLRMFWLGQNILDDRCYYCQKALPDGPEEIDHYIPIAKGGSHTPVNLRPSCSCCNRRKSSKDPIKFMQQLN